MSDTPLSQSESIAGKPIRRRYSLALKRQIVEVSLRPGVSAAQVARQYGLNGNLLHTWRWQYRNGLFGTVTDASSVSPTEGLIPVHVGADEPIDGSASETGRGLTIRFGEWHISLQGELDPTIVQMLLNAVAR
jgi:transposase-like protein